MHEIIRTIRLQVMVTFGHVCTSVMYLNSPCGGAVQPSCNPFPLHELAFHTRAVRAFGATLPYTCMHVLLPYVYC
jgi:hypothetical protein